MFYSPSEMCWRSELQQMSLTLTQAQFKVNSTCDAIFPHLPVTTLVFLLLLVPCGQTAYHCRLQALGDALETSPFFSSHEVGGGGGASGETY